MELEVVLFLLRVGDGILLLAILAAVLVILWKEYRQTASQLQSTQRTHGQLITLAEIDGRYTPTGDTHPLRPLTSLGRSHTNTIVVKNNFASSEHALIALRNGQWWLEDRQSRNGTVLNGDPITEPVVVTTGDIFSIGNISFRIEIGS